MTVRARYRILDPYGSVQYLSGTQPGGFFDDLQEAINACASLNATQDPAFQYVVVPVIHTPGT